MYRIGYMMSVVAHLHTYHFLVQKVACSDGASSILTILFFSSGAHHKEREKLHDVDRSSQSARRQQVGTEQ